MFQAVRLWFIQSVLRHHCPCPSPQWREDALNHIIDNLHLELLARKVELAQRLRPAVTWEELSAEMDKIAEEMGSA